MNNPIEMLKMIKDPRGFVMDYVKKNNNPILNNLVQQVEKGDNKAVEQFADNMLKEKGSSLNDIMDFLK